MSIEIDVTNGFPDFIIYEFKEAFTFFDKESTGKLKTSELGTVMRALGQNPTEMELMQIISEVDPDNTMTINFDVFIKMMQCKLCTTDMAEELRESFRLFDENETGVIVLSTLREIVTTLGDVFDENEVEEMIKDIEINENEEINYKEFINTIVSK